MLSLLLIAFAFQTRAHRLDEYLQATRVAVATNTITLSIDLTPGVAVYDQLIVVIDRDHDGRISRQEANDYARKVLIDLHVKLDDKPVKLLLVDIHFPTLNDAREGIGVIQMKAAVRFSALAAGQHELAIDNQHLRAISVYLVNALVPKDRAIKIIRQERNENQSNYRLVFRREPAA
ncbi:hypothetical protein GC207_10655 [bacterium]|nr:hypothetical protein [bacterium]